MTEEQYQKIKASVAEHRHRLETDPEYRKEYEDIEKEFEALGWPFGKYKG